MPLLNGATGKRDLALGDRDDHPLRAGPNPPPVADDRMGGGIPGRGGYHESTTRATVS